jgi:hypothetical protein
MSEDFYVGYIAKAPHDLARHVTRAVVCLLFFVVVIAAILVIAQSPFAPSKFEFGVLRDYDGIIDARPYPMLITGDGQYLLVGPGKHGFSASGLAGRRAKLRASLIERAPDSMLEVAHVDTQAGTARPPEEISLGSITIVGEIVDSKCYLGVMNPGNGKVHRDCAARCISGGVPSAFIARDASGQMRTLLLAGADGRPLRTEVLGYVAEPVQISGTLSRIGSTLILHAGGINRVAQRIPW